MNINELDKKHNAQAVNGNVAARVEIGTELSYIYTSVMVRGSITDDNLRYIFSTSEGGDFVRFLIPTDWKKGPHTLTAESQVIMFEPGRLHPLPSGRWTAVRGEVFITDDSNSNFSGTFHCYQYSNEEIPALMGGNFNVDFTSISQK